MVRMKVRCPLEHMNNDHIPLNSNGAAYTAPQTRDGIPLSYVSEKLALAIEDLNRHAGDYPDQSAGLCGAMYHALVAYLGLHNMLAKASDPTLAARMLNAERDELDRWLETVRRGGDVRGLADVA